MNDALGIGNSALDGFYGFMEPYAFGRTKLPSTKGELFNFANKAYNKF